MSEKEDLRSALVELDRLRAREQRTSRENATLLRLLDEMSRATSAEAAAHCLLSICAESLQVDDVALIGLQDAADIRVHASASGALSGLVWERAGRDLVTRPVRFVDLNARSWPSPPPAALASFKALLSAPLRVEGEAPMALILLCAEPAQFGRDDGLLLTRIAKLASQALATQRLSRRNALLANVIDGPGEGSDPPDTGFLDVPLEVVSRAFDRVTNLQTAVVTINNDLLCAPTAMIDAAIDRALEKVGGLTGIDRVYLFRLRAPDRMDNTHEWVADDIVPMIEHLQDMPRDLLTPWLRAFDEDREVAIPMVDDLPPDDPVKTILEEQDIQSLLAIPMRMDRSLTGFVGYDCVHKPRTFLPGEIMLLRSVGNTINAVLERRDAEARARDAQGALLSERNKMQTTLAALPDIVLELDSTGRFIGFHSGRNAGVSGFLSSIIGDTPEDALPGEGAAIAHRVMREVDARGRTEGHEFRFDLPDGGHRFQISAAARKDDTGGGYVFVIRDITEAHAQRREIERLSEVARRSTNLVVVSDAQGRIDWVNHAFTQRTGWSLDEVRGHTPGSFLQSEKTDSATIKQIGDALRACRPVQAEILNVARDGTEYWVDLDIQPLQDHRGRHYGFMAVEADVTERRAQEERLRLLRDEAVAAQERLTAAVAALKDGFVIFDADGRLALCNQPYRDFFPISGDLIHEGMTHEEILRLRLSHGEYPDAAGQEEAWLQARLQARRRPYYEVEQELADGRWVRSFETAMPDGGRVGLRVDITALKEAERRAVNERAAAMEASRDGIALTDPDGAFIYMNPAHMAMFGIGPDDDIHQLEWSDLYSAEVAEWMRRNAFPTLIAKGNWRDELTGQALDGTPVQQEVSLTLNENGGIVCITRDISDRLRNEQERARLREDLQVAQRREIVGQLAAGLAHDFNNILGVISGSAGLIEARHEDGNTDHQDAFRIRQASERATDLVARLRDLGRHETERKEIDLRKPFAEAVELLRAGLRKEHVCIMNVPKTPLVAMADHTDLVQVLLNLGINARDALSPGPNEIRLTLADADTINVTRAPDVGHIQDGCDHAVLRIEDTGSGVDEATRARMFEAYFTSKGKKGSGLGLAIVTGILRNNGAALWFDTDIGKGSCVTIYWPLEQRAARAPRPVADPGGQMRLDGMELLVVDDEKDICDVLAAMLEAAGAEVATTTDPAEALDALVGDPAHWTALVTDHDMPGMTGSDLARAARAARADLPIILVSALFEATCDPALFDAALPKPVSQEGLVAAILGSLRCRS